MFPYPNGGWAVQCVPPSLENKFGQRVSFPKEWASNIPLDGITFVHKGGFFARGEKNSLIELCNTAIQIEESKWKQRFEEYGEHCNPQKEQEALECILGRSVADKTKETNKKIR